MTPLPDFILALPVWLQWLALIWLGLCVGSFINVVAFRLPRMMQREELDWAREVLETPAQAESEPALNLMRPGSHCPACGHPVRPWHNVPVLGWLWLRGRCHDCNSAISVRYPLVEALAAGLGAVLFLLFGPSWELVWGLLFSWALLAASLIDLEYKLLPDVIVLPLLWLGLLINLNGTFASLPAAVIGAAVGYGSLWSLYWAFRLLTGREGMGYGDFKLLGAMGAWFGWAALPGIVLLSSATGVLVAASLMLAGRMRRETPMPFGPFIAAAGWLALVLTSTPMALPQV